MKDKNEQTDDCIPYFDDITNYNQRKNYILDLLAKPFDPEDEEEIINGEDDW